MVPPGRALRSLPPVAAARRHLGLPADGPVVAYVGRVTGIKRPDRFLAAARLVRDEIPDVSFVVCGDGDLAQSLSTAAGIHFLGWRGDVETVYAAADLVLLTSDNEGTPVCLIEAGLAGIPAVATRVGSVAEVVEDGRTGLLTGTDPGDLARAAVRLLEHPPLRRWMGQQARAVTRQRFGVERLLADMTSVYTGIAEERGWWAA